MIVSTLKLKNFMNVENASLEFKEGINVIGGPNGMGKSVIFAAQAFCLVGSKRGDSWKDYIKVGTDKMVIDLVLYKFKGDEPMSIHIEGLSSSSSMLKEIRYKNEYIKNTECDEFLERFFDLEMMENILFHLQDSSSIANITPAKRRDFLKKIFNSDFTYTVQTIKDDITQAKEAVKMAESRLSVLTSLSFELKVLERVPKINLEELKKNSDMLKAEILTLNELITTKKEVLKQMLITKVTSETNLKKVTLSKEALIKSIAEKESQRSSEDLSGISTMIEGNEKEIIELENSIQSLEPLLLGYKKENEERELECSALLSDLVKKKTLYNSADKQLKVFDVNSLCPTCGQPCDIKHKEVLEKEVATLAQEITQAQELYDSKVVEKENHKHFEKSSIDSCNLSKNKKKAKEDANGFLRKELVSKKEMQEQREVWIAKEKSQLIDLEKEENDAKQSLEEIEKTLDREKSSTEMLVYANSITEKEAKIQEYEITIRNVETTLLLNKEKEKYNDEIKNKEVETKVQIDSLYSLINTKKTEVVELEYVKSVFDSELPNHIMNKACSFLQEGINQFMATTKDNFQVQLVQNTKGIDFYYKARSEPDWLKAKLASGFESSLLTLAFKFTVALAYDSKFIIFDEPDKTADDISSLKLIETISKVDGFDQIFITSHRSLALQYLQENNANIIMVNNGVYSNY